MYKALAGLRDISRLVNFSKKLLVDFLFFFQKEEKGTNLFRVCV
jgi:hypothetical protein